MLLPKLYSIKENACMFIKIPLELIKNNSLSSEQISKTKASKSHHFSHLRMFNDKPFRSHQFTYKSKTCSSTAVIYHSLKMKSSQS